MLNKGPREHRTDQKAPRAEAGPALRIWSKPAVERLSTEFTFLNLNVGADGSAFDDDSRS